jgi:hypothetical protein
MKKYYLLMLFLSAFIIMQTKAQNPDIAPVGSSSVLYSGETQLVNPFNGTLMAKTSYKRIKYTRIFKGAPLTMRDFCPDIYTNVPSNPNAVGTPVSYQDNYIVLDGVWSDNGGANGATATFAKSGNIKIACDLYYGEWQNFEYYCEAVEITFGGLPIVCTSGSSINLNSYTNVNNASFSGTGVSGNYFVPSSVTAGTYTITLSKWNVTKTATIVVLSEPAPTSTLPTSLYNTDEEGNIDLTEYFSPSGGSFSVLFGSTPVTVTSNRYLNLYDLIPLNHPSISQRSITINYTISNSGCLKSITRNLNVVNNKVIITFNDIPNQCKTDNGEIDLNNYVSPQGGTFTSNGMGIIAGHFGSLERSGVPLITYSYTQNGHTFQAQKYVRINDRPNVEFSNISNVCVDQSIDLTNYIQPIGGRFTGTGVSGSTLNPSVPGIGNHTVYYTYTDANGCATTESKDFTITELNRTSVTWKNLPDLCANSNQIYLPNYINDFNQGTFSGSGVTGEYFDPSVSGAGNIKITYNYGSSSCRTALVKYIKVSSLPEVTFNALPNICKANEAINLMDYVNVKTGTFSGTGVNNNRFDSGVAGVGTHTISYSITVSGCTNVYTKTITVKAQMPTDLILQSLPDVCTQSKAFELTQYVNHQGGTFTGHGVTGNYFNPEAAGANQHQITYTLSNNGCSVTSSKVITVSAETSVSFYTIPTLCTKDAITLMSYVSHVGGTFNGAGVSNNKFFPENAGIGTHIITYTYTNSLGCVTVITQTITVSMLQDSNITFQNIPSCCVQSSSIYLRDYVNATDGTFSGRGVTGEYFNPAAAGAGVWTVTWTKSSSGCNQQLTKTITVSAEPNVVWYTIPSVCESNKVYDLSTYVSKTGGTFGGQGVTGTKFYADNAGIGTHTLSYTYIEGDCEVIRTTSIQVQGLTPANLVFNPINDQCVESAIIDLSQYVNVDGGTFSGRGVTGYYFNPATAGAGIHEISYKIINGSCSKTVKQTINVISSSSITFSPISIVCNSNTINLTSYVNPQGGTFSGRGVTGNIFDPAAAGVGTHTIFYNYANSSGCQSTSSQIISVDQLIEPTSWKPIPPVCGGTDVIYLPDYIDGAAGGTFSGTGVTGNYFNPSSTVAGIYTVTYTLASGRCKEQFTTTVQVKTLASVIFNTVTPVCYSALINLNSYVSPTGGTFSGDGIEGNNFNPVTAGLGNHVITYVYTTSNGCQTTAQKTINVINMLDNVEFQSLPTSCLEGNQINLRSYVNITGGTFSGPGVTGDVFNPKTAGEGMHTIKFNLNNGGCVVDLSQNITVNSSSNAEWYTVPSICYTTRILLNRYVNISGGLFTGNGVEQEGTNYYFNPVTAGIGTHQITYTFSDTYGCAVNIKTNISVDNLIAESAQWDELPRICVTSSTVYLPNYVNSLSGGTFSGRGVTGKYFNPSVAGAGTHTIAYTIQQGSCVLELETTITVDDVSSIVFNTIPDICTNALVNLNNYVSPQGGAFSGTGVDPSSPLIFDPNVSGLGQFTLTYQYTNSNGCTSSSSKVINVVNNLPDDIIFDLGTNDTKCLEDDAINLRNYVNSVEGTFKGPGVTGDFFSPIQAGAGIHKIQFFIENDGCRIERYEYVNVMAESKIAFTELPLVCNTDAIDLSQFVTPKGGHFVGNGVSGNTFYPNRAGVGKFEIAYSFTNAKGCVTTKTSQIEVGSLINPQIAFNSLPNVCVNADAVYLLEYIVNGNNYEIGEFSGNGVDGNYFNPSKAGKGTFTITYTIGKGSCKKTLKQPIKVIDADNLILNDLPLVCTVKKIDLNNYTTQTGTFTGNGVISNVFDPSAAGVGTHIISFKYYNSGCEFVIQKSITVNDLMPETIVFKDLGTYCKNSSAIDLRTFINVNENYLEFKGSGVDGNYFNPSNVNVGTYTITAIVGTGDCKTSVTKTVTVNGGAAVVFSEIHNVCYSTNIDLNNYVSPQGGTFVSPYVVGTVFSPSSAGVGTHTVTYMYMSNGCNTTVQRTINVVDLQPSTVNFNNLPDVCENGEPVKLSNYVNAGEYGDFIGTGVEGEYFNPSVSGVGAWTITYTVGTNKQCQRIYNQTIIVHPKDEIVFNDLPALCSADIIDLENYVSLKGGTFSGPGVSDNKFDALKAGQGSHLIVYNFTGLNNCKTVITKTITVPQIYQNVTFSSLPQLCENGKSISLGSYIDLAGGTFSGTGVTGNVFDPKTAGGGEHLITYTIGNATCSKTATQTIRVVDLPNITFSPIPDICFNEQINLKDFVNETGTFTGTGVIDNIFSPANAGVGSHTITFNYQQNGCLVSLNQTINVISIISTDIRFFPLPALCNSEQSIDLSEYTNQTGTFSGTGVTGNVFDPAAAGVGTHEITFEVGSNSCKKTLKQFITVYSNTTLKNTNNVIICHGEEYNLLNAVNVSGGTFSGNGVTGNIFYPVQTGSFEVTYQLTNRNNCTSEIKFNVTVNGIHPAEITFNEIQEQCLTSKSIDLRRYVSYYSDNVVFTGKGVTGYIFSPAIAGVGVHSITYTVGSETCKMILTKNIVVNNPTALTLSNENTFCQDKYIDLNNIVNVQGAIFSGRGVVNNVFSPSSAGVGTHTINCNFINEYGCASNASSQIQVKALNPDGVVFTDMPDVCQNDELIDLRNFINVTKEVVFSGDGVTGYYFDPSSAGEGTTEITATVGLVSGCKDQYKQIINVLPLPNVQFSTLPTICFSEQISLLDYVNVKTGTFSGNGVTGNIFDPAAAGIGTHKIIYDVTNDRGCRTIVDKTIVVKSLYPNSIKFSVIDNKCINSSSIQLNEYVDYLAGTFSGNGVIGMIFSPSTAGIGTHQIKYIVGDSDCKREYVQYITILPTIEVTFKALANICQDQTIDLSKYVSPQGGTFSGSGVNGNEINTTNLAIGTYEISYIYKDANGCSTTSKQTLNLLNKDLDGSAIVFNSIPDICISSDPIDLSSFVSNQGGTFSGPGVTGKIFDPAAAGAGVKLITYTVGNGTCQTVLSREVIVKSTVSVEWYDLPTVCKSADTIRLQNYVSIQGGTFTGIGVENDVFKRSLIKTLGNYTITYSFNTSNGCTIKTSKQITICDTIPQSVVFNAIDNVCSNSTRINLFEYVSYDNGTFSGTGVTDGLFDPSAAGVGEHKLSFTYGNGNCLTTISQYVTVNTSKDVTFTSPGKKCDSEPIDLSEYVNYKGGTFSGRGMTGNIFDPTVSGEGVFLITYTYNEENCTVKISQNIEVLNAKELLINVDRSTVQSSALVRFYSEGFEISNYRWEFGDGGYSLEKAPFHYYYHTGDFDVTLICYDSNGCLHNLKKEDFITVSDYNGLKSVVRVNDENAKVGFHNEDEGAKELLIYPNPFKESINISNPNQISGQIKVYDILGSLKITMNVTTEETIKIPTNELKPGVYMVEFDGKVFKMIKK